MGTQSRPRVLRGLVLGTIIGIFGTIVAWDVFTESRRLPAAWSWATTRVSSAAGQVRWGMTLSADSKRVARTRAVNTGLAKFLSKERIESRPVPFLTTSFEPDDILQGLPATIEFVTDTEAKRRAVAGYDPDYKYQRYGAFGLASGGYTWTGVDFWLCRRLYQTEQGVVSSLTDMCLKMHCKPRGDGFQCEIVDGWVT